MRKALLALVAVVTLVLAGTAVAGKVGQGKLWVYDPNGTGKGSAAWTKDGLSLQKNTATADLVASGMSIKGLEGDTLTQLSFDVKNGSYCGAGAPRFNVYVGSTTYFFGCIYGTHTDLGNGWTHVVFNGSEPGAGGFGSAIDGSEIVMDEQGQTLLRNVSVNGVAINKFPNG